MSFDLFFCREEPTDVTVKELRNWTKKWKHFTEYSGEGSFDFGYKNENTGVYFAIGYGFPDGAARPEPDDPELPTFVDGYFPVSLDFNINFQRPSFFALEAMPIVFDLAKTFNLLMGNPQHLEPDEDPEPLLEKYPHEPQRRMFFEGKNDAGETEQFEVVSIPEGTTLPSRFPTTAMHPGFYSVEELVTDWRRINDFCAEVEYFAQKDAEENDGSDAINFASPESALAYWRYMREYDSLCAEFDDFRVHKIYFVKKDQTERVYTASIWAGPCSEIFPPVDYLIIPREVRSLFGLRRKEKYFLTKPDNVLNLLQPGLQTYDAIPGTFLITEDTLINSEEDGIFDQAQKFFGSSSIARCNALAPSSN